MDVHPGHFVPNPDNARDLFRASVGCIEIEISSYCNRRCGFCPNSILDRISGQRFMDDALFRDIMLQLGALGWGGTLSFHRYNEPLADRAYLLRRLRQARTWASSAFIRLFTNGDYLTPDYLDEIRRLGCGSVICSVYLQEGRVYDDAEMMSAIARRLRMLGRPYDWEVSEPGLHLARLRDDAMEIIVRGQDFYRPDANGPAGSSRGGILPLDRGWVRTDACLKPFAEMQIEVDGTLLPCCELRSDHPSHQGSVLGRLKPGDDIADAWAGAAYVAWRRHLLSFEPKQGPCASCRSPGIGDDADLRATVAMIRQEWMA